MAERRMKVAVRQGLVVIVSALMGTPMNLVFTSPLELVAIGAVVFAVDAIAHDGETT